jgi:hypothetical protein
VLAGASEVRAQTPSASQWQQTFGGTGTNECRIVKQTADGNYILGGYSNSGISGNKTSANFGAYDFWVLKVDGNGNKLWENTFGGSATDAMYGLQPTSDGGYILGGNSSSPVSGNKTNGSYGINDYWVVKIDGNGNKVWDRSYGGTSGDQLWSLQQTSDGGYILGGYSGSGVSGNKGSTNHGGEDYWVVKIDGNGNKIWDKSFGGSADDELWSLQQTSDGGYILGGYSGSGISGNKTSTNYGFDDCWVVKIDTNGVKVWEKSFGGTGFDYLSCLQQTSDDGYILGGYSNSGISGNKSSANRGGDDYWVVKIDGSGNKIWDRSFGGSSGEDLWSLRQTSEGGYILGGHSNSAISGDKTSLHYGSSDYWVVKIDDIGNKIWEKSFGGNSFDPLYGLQQTSDGGYILGGRSSSPISGNKTSAKYGPYDYWIVKLAPEPPMISSIAVTNSAVKLVWQTVPGKTYRVQYKENLQPGDWTPIGNDVSATGATLSITNGAAASLGFYRILQVD